MEGDLKNLMNYQANTTTKRVICIIFYVFSLKKYQRMQICILVHRHVQFFLLIFFLDAKNDAKKVINDTKIDAKIAFKDAKSNAK